MMLEENFWYWLAGLLEGEGSFLAPSPSAPHTPRVSIQMIDEDVVLKIIKPFSISYCYGCERKPGSWRKIYRATIVGTKAIKLMRSIQPLMGNRRQEQIEKAITKSQRDDEPYVYIQTPIQDSIQEMYWLAGLLEAEGSFLSAPPSETNSIRVQLCMTDEDIVARVSNIWGINYKSYSRNERVKRAYHVTLRGKRAVELMQQLHPLMGIRRQGQIDKALASYDPDFYRKSHMKQCALQPDEVRRVRQLLKQGYKHKEIAEMYDVKWTVIADISCGRTWAWLAD